MARRTAVALGALLIAATALYSWRLAEVPAYLMHDEVNFAIQAQAIASTGRDTNGRLLPVYFSETGFEAGRDPVMIYVTALMLTLWPLSESAVRLPTVLTGMVSVGVMFLVARRLFRSDALGLTAAALLAVTPGLFINSRLALSITYPIPFILAWLWCVTRFLTGGDRRHLFGAGFVLGVGMYTYAASLIMMPLYLAFTMMIVGRERRTLAWAAVLGFAVALVPMGAWQVMHPDRYLNLLQAYQVQDAARGPSFASRLGTFWMFFNPDYLFLSGDSRLTNSTRTAGLFPLACAAFIPVGVYQLWRGRNNALGQCILAGFLTAPLATVISGRLEINRVLNAIPFGVLVAVYGMTALLSARRPSIRFLTRALMLSVVLQFGFVYADYMTAYRTRSAPWFGGDARGAIADILARVQSAPVYLDGRTPMERYWRFYALARGTTALVDRPTYYDAHDFKPSEAPAGALLACTHGDLVCRALGDRGDWRRISSRTEPDATTSFEVFEKTHPDQ